MRRIATSIGAGLTVGVMLVAFVGGAGAQNVGDTIAGAMRNAEVSILGLPTSSEAPHEVTRSAGQARYRCADRSTGVSRGK